MNDFKAIYRILKALSDAIDFEQFDASRISPEAVGVSARRLNALLAMLAQAGYVEGFSVRSYVSSADPWPTVTPVAPRITLKGLEYLAENSLMRKCADAAMGIVSTVL